jgi:hypothetical protein
MSLSYFKESPKMNYNENYEPSVDFYEVIFLPLRSDLYKTF